MDAMDRKYIGNIENFATVEEFEKSLEGLLSSGCYIWDDGSLIAAKELVERVKGLRIEIRSNEHAPPHFHVTSESGSASFTINDGAILKGTLKSREIKVIRYWYKKSKKDLIKVWNRTRPSGCDVGNISDSG